MKTLTRCTDNRPSQLEVLLWNAIQRVARVMKISVFDGREYIVDVDSGNRSIMVEHQLAFESYFVDFAISTPSSKFFVECDGHDFHDRTKQQAAYDRSRDRRALMFGIPTIRFTGSEIYHSAERCARELLDIVERQLDLEAQEER